MLKFWVCYKCRRVAAAEGPAAVVPPEGWAYKWSSTPEDLDDTMFVQCPVCRVISNIESTGQDLERRREEEE